MADLIDGVDAYTFDGDRSSLDHISGEPIERDFVQGDKDPRDASLAEKPHNRLGIFNAPIKNGVNKLGQLYKVNVQELVGIRT